MLWWTLRKLKSEDIDKRSQAVEDLAKSNSPRVVSVLAEVRNREGGNYVGQMALEALESITDRRFVKPLIVALKDQDEDVRRAAAKALGNIGDGRALESLIAALKDEDGEVRFRAASALGHIRDARALEPLVEALKKALTALANREAFDRMSVEEVTNISNLEWAATIALGRIGDARAVESLVAALEKSGTWQVRRDAAIALGQVKDVRAVEPLIVALKEGSPWEVRTAAGGALSEIGDQRAVEPLTAALNDEYEGVRQAAEDALKKIKSASTGASGIDYAGLDILLSKMESEIRNGAKFPIHRLRVKNEGSFGKVIAWSYIGDKDLDTNAAERLLDSRLATLGLRTGSGTVTSDDDGSVMSFWRIQEL